MNHLTNKNQLFVSVLIILSGAIFAQDLIIANNPYENVPEEISQRKSFNREKWFYEQRMYPNNFIPENAYKNAIEQRNELRDRQGFYINSSKNTEVTFSPWKNIGPTPGYYSSYTNISSRITTIQYDPVNPNIIYLGAAFGGVWKSTDGGNTWNSKTDNEVSLSSGSIAIDPAKYKYNLLRNR